MRAIALGFVAISFSALFLACGEERTSFTEEELRDYQECEVATDCVWAQNGCCDCNNGGEAIAVNKDRAAEFRSEFTCEEEACTLKGGASCERGTISCEDNLCKFKRAADDGNPGSN